MTPAVGAGRGLPLGWLASDRVVLALILGYLALHLGFRLLASPTLGVDDAEQALLAQQWAWGYQIRQPPLYTWLLLPLFGLFGVDLLALSLLRYLLLGATFVLMHRVARRWIGDRRLAALAVLSYPSIYLFGYFAHHDLTHTTALTAAIAATFLAFARLVERPDAARYLVLGVCLGLGLLAKWNFVMLVAGLGVTCLLHRPFRALVLSPKTLLAIGAMALMVAPTVLWTLGHPESVGATAQAVLVDRPRGFFVALGRGTLALAASVVTYPMPFLVMFGLAFASALGRALRTGGPAASGAPRVTPGFLATLIGVTVALHWLLIPSVGAVAFTERWLHPALMILPVLLFALLERGRPSARAMTVYVVMLALVATAALGARIARYAVGGEHCGRCREFVPFTALAQQLRAAGFSRGTIVADGVHIGGNLRIFFADSRIVDPAQPLSAWPPATDPGQCVAVWEAQGSGADAGRRRVERYLTVVLGVPPDAIPPASRLEAPMLGSETRTYSLGYEIFADGSGTCR